MRRRRTIRLFEHERVAVGDLPSCVEGGRVRFTEHHLDALARFNDRNGGRYFTLGRKSLRASEYVGFVQVGSLGIEVVPKVSGADGSKETWHRALLQMLLAVRQLTLRPSSRASLGTTRANLLTVYVLAFLDQVELLFHQGLARRYRTARSNGPTYRGRLLVAEQIRRNLVQRQRFAVEHQTYDHRHLIHRVLDHALLLLLRSGLWPELQPRIRALRAWFPAQDLAAPSREELDRIRFDRNTDRYRDAVTIARLLLLHQAPRLRGGCHDLFAILFDMNALFEAYVSREVRLALGASYRVTAQESRPFWRCGTLRRSLQPDILICDRASSSRLVADCKWKDPLTSAPSVEDLRQVFAYNEFFRADSGCLLYPHPGDHPTAIRSGVFAPKGTSAHLAQIAIVRNGALDRPFVRRQLRDVVEHCLGWTAHAVRR